MLVAVLILFFLNTQCIYGYSTENIEYVFTWTIDTYTIQILVHSRHTPLDEASLEHEIVINEQ